MNARAEAGAGDSDFAIGCAFGGRHVGDGEAAWLNGLALRSRCRGFDRVVVAVPGGMRMSVRVMMMIAGLVWMRVNVPVIVLIGIQSGLGVPRKRKRKH